MRGLPLSVVLVLGALAVLALDGPPAPVKSAAAAAASGAGVRPDPREAKYHRPRVWEDRCEVSPPQIRITRECVYGDPDGEVTIALTGDSLGSASFPAVNALAKLRGWRLISLTKAGCAPFRTLFYNNKLDREYWECLRWQEDMLQRFKREQPEIVFSIGYTFHRAVVGGERLRPASPLSRKRIAMGYVKMLEKFRRLGAQPILLKDTPRAPYDLADCVAENLDKPSRCDYPITRGHRRQGFERWAASQVEGARLINLTRFFCPDRVCRAVIDNRLVLRDRLHPSPSFTRTLGPALDKRVPDPARDRVDIPRS